MSDWNVPGRPDRPRPPGSSSGPPPPGSAAGARPPDAAPRRGPPSADGIPSRPPPPPGPAGRPPTATGWEDLPPPGSAAADPGPGSQPPPPVGGTFGAGTPTVGDIIETMFQVYRATFRTSSVVVATLVLPGLVVISIGFLQLSDLFVLVQDPAAVASFTEAQLLQILQDPVVWIGMVLGSLLLAIGQFAAMPALMRVGADHLAGEQPAVGPALKVGLRRLWGIGVVWITLFLLVGVVALAPLAPMAAAVEFALLFLLTVPLAIALAFLVVMVGHLVAATVVVEDLGAWSALGRVTTLLRRSFWPTFGRGLVVGFLVSVIGWVISAAGQITGLAGPDVVVVATVVVAILGYLVSTPLGIFGGLALYGDLRVRTEGSDVLGAAGRLGR